MSEAQMKVEKKETGAVRRITDRIGKFLSETYTIKGAKAKEMGKYAALYSQFTPAQQTEMKAFYEKKVGKTATWKVIRNWVVTGAGLALGYGLLQPGGAAAIGKFAVDALNFLGIQFQPVNPNLLLNPPLPAISQDFGIKTWLTLSSIDFSKITTGLRGIAAKGP